MGSDLSKWFLVGFAECRPSVVDIGVGQGYEDLKRFEKGDVWKGLGLG